MSVIIHLMGRVTTDPVMQQGRNIGTEYVSLDLATSQRSQNAQNNPENPYESVFYQCYLNKHLAERLSKSGSRKEPVCISMEILNSIPLFTVSDCFRPSSPLPVYYLFCKYRDFRFARTDPARCRRETFRSPE